MHQTDISRGLRAKAAKNVPVTVDQNGKEVKTRTPRFRRLASFVLVAAIVAGE